MRFIDADALVSAINAGNIATVEDIADFQSPKRRFNELTKEELDEYIDLTFALRFMMEMLTMPTPDYVGSKVMLDDLKNADKLLEVIYDRYNIADEDRAKHPFSSAFKETFKEADNGKSEG